MERSVIRGPASPRGTGCGEAVPAFRFAPCGLREILFSLCQTANASPPVWPLPRARRAGLRLLSWIKAHGELFERFQIHNAARTISEPTTAAVTSRSEIAILSRPG